MISPKLLLSFVAISSLSFVGYNAYAAFSQQNRILGAKAVTKTKVTARAVRNTVAKKFILSARTVKGIDPKTGIGKKTTNIFSTKDPVIYLSLTVAKPPKGTKFEYVRYFKGKYIDHGSLDTTKNAMKNVSFAWRLKDSKSKHLAGRYRVKLYVNGSFEREIAFTVK